MGWELLASGTQRPATLLNSLRCTGQAPRPTRHRRIADENVNRVLKMTKPAFDGAAQSSEVVESGHSPVAGTGQAEAGSSFRLLEAFPLDRPLVTRHSVKRGGAPRTVSSRLVPRRFGRREDQSSICILTGRFGPKTPARTLARRPEDHPSP